MDCLLMKSMLSQIQLKFMELVSKQLLKSTF